MSPSVVAGFKEPLSHILGSAAVFNRNDLGLIFRCCLRAQCKYSPGLRSQLPASCLCIYCLSASMLLLTLALHVS